MRRRNEKCLIVEVVSVIFIELLYLSFLCFFYFYIVLVFCVRKEEALVLRMALEVCSVGER